MLKSKQKDKRKIKMKNQTLTRIYEIIVKVIVFAALWAILTSLLGCGRGPRGVKGDAGPQGPNGENSEVIQVLRPCAPNTDIILVLADGTLVANYDGGPHDDRLVELTVPNTYGPMEGFSCDFELDANGDLI